jgi:hypothetical protein
MRVPALDSLVPYRIFFYEGHRAGGFAISASSVSQHRRTNNAGVDDELAARGLPAEESAEYLDHNA